MGVAPMLWPSWLGWRGLLYPGGGAFALASQANRPASCTPVEEGAQTSLLCLVVAVKLRGVAWVVLCTCEHVHVWLLMKMMAHVCLVSVSAVTNKGVHLDLCACPSGKEEGPCILSSCLVATNRGTRSLLSVCECHRRFSSSDQLHHASTTDHLLARRADHLPHAHRLVVE